MTSYFHIQKHVPLHNMVREREERGGGIKGERLGDRETKGQRNRETERE